MIIREKALRLKRLCIFTLFIIGCMVTLVACDKAQTKTYEGDENGKQIITSLTFKGDKVLKQSTIGTLKYDDLGIDKAKAKQMFSKNKDMYSNIEGVTYSTDYKSDKAIEHIDIDYEKTNLKQLKEKLGFVSPNVKDDYVSFKKLEKHLKHNGLTVKSNMTE